MRSVVQSVVQSVSVVEQLSSVNLQVKCHDVGLQLCCSFAVLVGFVGRVVDECSMMNRVSMRSHEVAARMEACWATHPGIGSFANFVRGPHSHCS